MPTPSAQAFPHEVSHTYNTWKGDADGGRTISSQVTRGGYACSVQPGKTRKEVDDEGEKGLRRVTFWTEYTVIYPDNPRLNVEDLILWTDEEDGTFTQHTIQVTGRRNVVGLGSVWEVYGEERV